MHRQFAFNSICAYDCFDDFRFKLSNFRARQEIILVIGDDDVQLSRRKTQISRQQVKLIIAKNLSNAELLNVLAYVELSNAQVNVTDGVARTEILRIVNHLQHIAVLFDAIGGLIENVGCINLP